MAGISDLFGFLFGSTEKNDADAELVKLAVEAIVDQVEPRVRLDTAYERKLARGVRHTMAYLRSLRDGLPQDVLLMARAQWALDPRLNAFFARADDVHPSIRIAGYLESTFFPAALPSVWATVG